MRPRRSPVIAGSSRSGTARRSSGRCRGRRAVPVLLPLPVPVAAVAVAVVAAGRCRRCRSPSPRRRAERAAARCRRCRRRRPWPSVAWRRRAGDVVGGGRGRRRRASVLLVDAVSTEPDAATASDCVERGHGKMSRRPTATAIGGSGSTNASAKSLLPLRAKPSTMRHCRPAALGPVTSGSSTAASSSLTAVSCGVTDGYCTVTPGLSRNHWRIFGGRRVVLGVRRRRQHVAGGVDHDHEEVLAGTLGAVRGGRVRGGGADDRRRPHEPAGNRAARDQLATAETARVSWFVARPAWWRRFPQLVGCGLRVDRSARSIVDGDGAVPEPKKAWKPYHCAEPGPPGSDGRGLPPEHRAAPDRPAAPPRASAAFVFRDGRGDLGAWSGDTATVTARSASSGPDSMQILFVSSVAAGGSGMSQRQLARRLDRARATGSTSSPRRPTAPWSARSTTGWSTPAPGCGRRRSARRCSRSSGGLGRRIRPARHRRPPDAVRGGPRERGRPDARGTGRPDVVVANSIDRVLVAPAAGPAAARRGSRACCTCARRRASATSRCPARAPDLLLANAREPRRPRARGRASRARSCRRSSRSRRSRRPARVVLLVNPIEILGGDRIWAIAAARPDIPFVIQESGLLDEHLRADIARPRRAGVPNVEVRPFSDRPGRALRRLPRAARAPPRRQPAARGARGAGERHPGGRERAARSGRVGRARAA